MSKVPMIAFAASLLALAGGQALAHARLMTSTPSANAATAAPETIALHFSEAPMEKFSGVELSTSAGAAVATRPMPASDTKTISIAPISPLKAGVYSVKWHVVTADTHRTQGAYVFTVK